MTKRWQQGLGLLLALAWAGYAWAAEPLVALDAQGLPEGPVANWTSTGSLKATFGNDGTRPTVKVVDGVKAVVFSGRDHMTADAMAPAGITGDKPWTCIVRAWSTETRGERAVLAWANRPNSCLELEYGDARQYGAVGTWNDPNTLGWGELPKTGQWHTLVYTYTGGPDGDLQAWCDGDLRASRKATLATKANKPFVLGGCMYGGDEPQDKHSYEHLFNGALAGVQVFDRVLSPVEIWNASGQKAAYPVAPQRGSTLDKTTATLKWLAGSPETAAYDLYLGTDAAAVEKADNTLPVGQAQEWQKVYKGKIATAEAPSYGPLQLDLSNTYYWRVDQRDASGKVTQRGLVAKFMTETGQAAEPSPENGFIFVEGGKKELHWKPGAYAVKQNLYLAESAEAVLAKKTPDVADLAATANTLPLPLKDPPLGKTYFWRVETINRDNLSVSRGEVWSFRTVSKKLKVYLLGGQSNAVGCSSINGMPENFKGIQKGVIIFVRGECRLNLPGWTCLREGLGSSFGDYDGRGTIGPELTFGMNMAPQSPDQVIAILKCAWGGTNLGAQWRPPSAGGQTGELYTKFVKALHEGIAALDPAFEPEFAGMIWMQGESDSADVRMAEDYAKNLTSLIKDIRAETKTPNLPFVFAQIAKVPAWDSPPNRGPQIRAAQLEVSKAVPYTATFSTEDYKMCDPWHYDMAGMLSLGERFAKAMKELEKGRAAP